MKDLIFILADLWLIFAGFYFGGKLIRRYGNYLLGLEWMVVGTSASAFFAASLLGEDDGHVFYEFTYFTDAFSRSVGITLILVLGLLAVTHRYRPPLAVDIGVFALAIAVGLYLQQFGGDGELHLGPATFYVVVNGLTTLFLTYVATRLWRTRSRWLAIWTGLITLVACAIALTYDFFPLPFDDEQRTIFYTAALATWGTQGFVYYFAYRALHAHNVATGVQLTRKAGAKS